jgi:serine/threonine protein kinase
LLDFGLAKWHGGAPEAVISGVQAIAHPTLTDVGSVVGTIQYMAPEQVEGKPADARSDLFALGAIIYEMTTGRKAFEGTSATSVMAAILSFVPSPMTTVQPLTPQALDRLVRKCLAKDPAKRWQTAADLRDELQWIEEGTATVTPEPSTKSAQRRIRRFWLGAVTTLAVLLAALAVFTISLVNRIRSDLPAPVTSFVVLPPDNASAAEHPTISPDGRKLAFIARAADGKSSLWV